MKLKTISANIFILLFIANLATASDSAKYKTEEITVLGNRGIISTSLLPGFVQTMNREDILNSNGSDLSDVLRKFAGLNIREYGGGASLGTISMNGCGSENTLILVDGARLNSPQNNTFDVSLFSKENISRIEVLSGGMSSLYGSDAMAGVINIVTGRAAENNTSFSLNASVGSFGSTIFGLSGSQNFGGLSAFVSLSSEKSDNDYEYYFGKGVQKELKRRKNSSYSRRFLDANITYLLKSQTKLGYKLSLSDADRNLPGIETGSEPSNAVQTDNMWRNLISADHQVSKSFSISGLLTFSNDLSKYSDKIFAESYFKNLQTGVTGKTTYSAGDFTVNAGAEFFSYSLESNQMTTLSRRNQYSAFVTAEKDIAEGVRIFPSARFDNLSDIGESPLTGSVGLNITPAFLQGLFVKARIGNNFTAPSFNSMYWNPGGNPDLKPENSVSFSSGAGIELPLFSSATAELSYTKINADNKIIWLLSSSGYWEPMNVRQVSSNEIILLLSAEQSAAKNIMVNGDVSFAFTYAKKSAPDFEGDRSTGKQLPYIPTFTSKASLNARTGKLRAGLFYQYVGSRFTNAANTAELNPVSLLDANLEFGIDLKGVDLTARLEGNNLTNENYEMIAGYPMPLRNFVFKIKLEY